MSDSRTFRVQRATSDFRWPNGARIGIVFNLAYEAWSPGKAPGIGPMGNVLQPGFFDTNAHSWASYGAVRGIQRLTRIAAANDVKTSIMVNGVLAETHPTVLKELHAAGHEIVAHSYGMDVIPVYFDEAGERANIRRTGDLIAAVTGERPKGWISPRGTGSPISPKLLAEEGYVWFGDCNDDDLPSIITQKDAPEQRIVGIPLTMDVNDLPHSIRYGNAPATLIDQFRAILDNANQADAAPFMLDVTAHTHVFGRPAGAWVYDAMIKLARKRDDVWIGTRMEIAEYALAQGRWFKDEVF
ncbi:polysaccharide deacetylase family protein [Tardiphaga sp. OK245]|uniref:polysaccharide deacetylase family protein n=1 Tax=Tardiphaga sp. OK245 TaxID=1855306 RepID=UPI0008A7C1B3|nr:polysaccharide deacetylase family protein [Tardiphaga sp. OK245]SEH69595.1 Peptidoglycan/xylan/chitin deacetylase, PgdA/CDA1 family [Tardiphaga sp. OK245]